LADAVQGVVSFKTQRENMANL